MNTHNQNGGTLAFIVSSSFILTVLGIGVYFLVMIVGGGRELQHANDAGNLNVAKNALLTPSLSLNPTDDNESQFFSPDPAISGIDNRVNLNNVNRLFAHSLIVQANAKAMLDEHSSTDNTLSNATKVKQEANRLGTNLAKQLNDKSNLQDFFLNLTNGNSIRMLISGTQNGSEISQSIHDVSYADRQFASNVDIADGQIPDTIRSVYNNNQRGKWTIPVNLGSKDKENVRYFLRGYTDNIQFTNDIGDIHFVPLKSRSADENPNENIGRFLNSQPHLIARRGFEERKTPKSGPNAFNWNDAIPNAFLSQGNARDSHSSTMLGLTSCAISQSLLPTMGYRAAIHRGYVRIKNVSGITLDQSFSVGHSGDNDVYGVLMDQFGDPGHELYWTYTDINNPNKYFFEVGGTNNITKLHNWAQNQSGPFPSSAANALLPPTGKSSDRWEHCAAQQLTYKNVDAAMAQYPRLKDALGLVFGIDFSTDTTKVSVKSAHAVEAGNLELLSQRSNGAQTVHLHTWRSGVALNATSRGKLPFPKFKFIPNIAQGEEESARQFPIDNVLPNTGNAVDIRKRIAQRCQEIDPNFQSSDLPGLLASCNISLRNDGTNTAYIFFDDSAGHLVVRTSNSLPTWLKQLAFDSNGNEIKADGIPSTWYVRKSGNLSRHVINRPGDWGYPSPYDNYPDDAFLYELFTFTPCTGLHGLLGEVNLEAAFCSENKPSTSGDEAYSGHGVKPPVLCPGTGAPFTNCPSCVYDGPC